MQMINMKALQKIVAVITSSVLMLLSATACSANSVNDDAKVSKDMTTADVKASKTVTTAVDVKDSKETPKETVKTSADFAKEMGIGWNLGNTFDGFYSGDNEMTGASVIGQNKPSNYETCWGAVITTEECMKGIKEAGFNTVRIPVYWGNMMGDKFEISDQLFDRIEEVVNYCLDNDLYVVLNIHHYDEYIIKHYSKSNALKIMDSLWKQIAKRFKDYPDRLIFEGYNENVGSHREKDTFTDDEMYDYVNELNQTFVSAVRKMGGNNDNRMLIISGYHTNIDRTTDKRFKLPEDTVEDRIMVSVHYVDNSMFWGNKVGGKEWRDYCKSQCELLKKAFVDKGIQVFLGECSFHWDEDRLASDAKGRTSAEILKERTQMELDYGLIPIIWDTNNDFYSRTECKINDPASAVVIKELTDELKAKQ